MPSITHFEIYKPAEPCSYTGEKLREIMEKIIFETLSPDGKDLSLKGYCIGQKTLFLSEIEYFRIITHCL